MLGAMDVDTDGVGITVRYCERSLPARIVGETLAIDGHGQPVDRMLPVTLTVVSSNRLKTADIVRKYLASRGYEHVRVCYV